MDRKRNNKRKAFILAISSKSTQSAQEDGFFKPVIYPVAGQLLVFSSLNKTAESSDLNRCIQTLLVAEELEA
jgi:hypothetical protein